MSNLTTKFSIKLKKNEHTFPAEILESSHLEDLEVYAENLKSIPEQIGKLQMLKRLYVISKGLQEIAKEIFLLPNLTTLKLAGGKLELLPSLDISAPSQLRNLYLCNNNLRQLPDWLGQLTTLEFLDLSGNQLNVLPSSFSQLHRLKRLNIDNNQFSVLPQTLTQLPSLNHLSLDNNPFTPEEKQKIFQHFSIW